MLNNAWLLFWLVGLLVVGIWAASSFWSREARLQRRRRKSHTRLVQRNNRPRIRFSVRLPGRKRKE